MGRAGRFQRHRFCRHDQRRARVVGADQRSAVLIPIPCR
jgi:hypothetical protein